MKERNRKVVFLKLNSMVSGQDVSLQSIEKKNYWVKHVGRNRLENDCAGPFCGICGAKYASTTEHVGKHAKGLQMLKSFTPCVDVVGGI